MFLLAVNLSINIIIYLFSIIYFGTIETTFCQSTLNESYVIYYSDIQTLAWCTAQIHCQCTLSTASVSTQTTELLTSTDSTSATLATPAHTYFNPTRGKRKHNYNLQYVQ